MTLSLKFSYAKRKVWAMLKKNIYMLKSMREKNLYAKEHE
jgi:hypothetical protein